MEKDLAMSGVSHEFTDTSDAQILLEELAEHLKKIDKGSNVANLFYRIDMRADLADGRSWLEYSSLAWNRVLQKVINRNLYSKLNP